MTTLFPPAIAVGGVVVVVIFVAAAGVAANDVVAPNGLVEAVDAGIGVVGVGAGIGTEALPAAVVETGSADDDGAGGGRDLFPFPSD